MAPILGALFAVLVGLLAIRPYIGYQQQSFQNIQAANTASQFKQILDAVQAYIQSGCPGDSATGCVAGSISLSSLQPAFLPSAISGQSGPNGTTIFYNPYGQQWNVSIQTVKVPNSSQAAFQALVYSTGGNQISAASTAQIAAETGTEGGFFPYRGQYGQNTPDNTALGAYGHWQVPLSTYNIVGSNYALAGHLAGLLYFSPDGTLNQDYLYRNVVPGDPDVNTMNASINMNNNNSITNAQTVQVGNQTGTGLASVMAEMANTTDDPNGKGGVLSGGMVVTSDPTGVNTTTTESDSLGSSVILSAATSGSGTNTATMTTNSAQTSLALAGSTPTVSLTGSTPTLTLNGSESNLSVTGTQAALLVGQSTAASATNLQFISTPETVGASCYSSTGTIPAWGTPNTTTYYPLGTIAPNADGSGRPLVCASQTEALAVNSSSGSITISSGASSTSASWQLIGASGSFSQSTSETLYPYVINGTTNNASWATSYVNNTYEPLYISSNCSPMSGTSYTSIFFPSGSDAAVSLNFYVVPPAGSNGGTAWTLSVIDNVQYASPSTSIVVPPGYSFYYSLYGGSTVVQQSNGVYTTVPLRACKFQIAY